MENQPKIISLHQPRASFISLGLKSFETRSWSTKYRGKLVIHAAKRSYKQQSEHESIAEKACQLAGWGAFDRRTLDFLGGLKYSSLRLPLGQIVAIADLTACLCMVEKYELYAWKHLGTGNISKQMRCRSKEDLFERSGFGEVRVDEPVKGFLAVPVTQKGEEAIAISEQSELELLVGDWRPGRYAWRLKNIVGLPHPIPYKGAQGLRNLDIATAKQITSHAENKA